MKKIMFNDKVLLTQAVIEGRKTQTRRIITCPQSYKGQYVSGFHVYKRELDGFISEICMYDEDERDFDEGQILPKYKVGEIVAVAQSYDTIDNFYKEAFSYNHSAHGMTICEFDGVSDEDVQKWNMIAVNYRGKKSWTNKLFVKPELMIHFIRITNVRIQRLQDISDEDCLAEGVKKIISEDGTPRYYVKDWKGDTLLATDTPQNAYAFLIDRVGQNGDWESNPYVFVYDFELIK